MFGFIFKPARITPLYPCAAAQPLRLILYGALELALYHLTVSSPLCSLYAPPMAPYTASPWAMVAVLMAMDPAAGLQCLHQEIALFRTVVGSMQETWQGQLAEHTRCNGQITICESQ
jgi:hypothetical protein